MRVSVSRLELLSLVEFLRVGLVSFVGLEFELGLLFGCLLLYSELNMSVSWIAIGLVSEALSQSSYSGIAKQLAVCNKNNNQKITK